MHIKSTLIVLALAGFATSAGAQTGPAIQPQDSGFQTKQKTQTLPTNGSPQTREIHSGERKTGPLADFYELVAQHKAKPVSTKTLLSAVGKAERPSETLGQEIAVIEVAKQ